MILHAELEPSLNITASHGNPVLAGTELTLTCVGVSDRAADLYWVNSNGYEISSGNGIEISVPQAKQGTTYSIIILTFVSLKTSRAGIYRCKYDIDDPITTSHHVDVQSKLWPLLHHCMLCVLSFSSGAQSVNIPRSRIPRSALHISFSGVDVCDRTDS